MSRTYRIHEDYCHYANGNFYTTEEWIESPFAIGWSLAFVIDKKGRDRKSWDKPPKWFKKQNRRREKAQVRQAMRREQYDNIPEFRMYDQWDWT